jgi:hypothetical protein
MLNEMKGPGRTLLICEADATRFELIGFLDGSLAIKNNGIVINFWERAEEEDCLRSFVAATNLNSADKPLLVVRLRKPAAVSNGFSPCLN